MDYPDSVRSRAWWRMVKPREPVTASEIAIWISCPESWRLDARDLQSSNQPARDAATGYHARLATAELTAGGVIAFGFGLIAMAVLALGLLWWLQR